MRELNNLRGNDREIFERKGEDIKAFMAADGEPLLSYIKGLIMMSMHDLDYTDTDIEFVVDEVAGKLFEVEPVDVITYEWTHDYERK